MLVKLFKVFMSYNRTYKQTDKQRLLLYMYRYYPGNSALSGIKVDQLNLKFIYPANIHEGSNVVLDYNF